MNRFQNLFGFFTARLDLLSNALSAPDQATSSMVEVFTIVESSALDALAVLATGGDAEVRKLLCFLLVGGSPFVCESVGNGVEMFPIPGTICDME
jgi:hypothetical protein